MYYAWTVTRELFDALHYGSDTEAKCYWKHQEFDRFRVHDSGRGIAIDKHLLINTAMLYLSHAEIQVNKLDWILLDAIVFQELEAYAYHVFLTRGGAGFNWAAIFESRNAIKYYGLTLIFWLLGLLVTFVAPPAAAYYLFAHDHQTAAVVVAVLWMLSLGYRLLTYPFRWRARRKAWRLLQCLIDVYRILGDRTISPRRLKEALDTAAADGVVLDGAVFTIVDRIIIKDPTAFIPTFRG
jgi:hypothetical protein